MTDTKPQKQTSDPVIWDLPLRVFHWLLVLCVVTSVTSAKLGLTAIHERSGLAVMALILFRFVWGFSGSQTARFSSFLKSPLNVWYSLRKLMLKQTDDLSGHSALGGYATIVLLAICIIMAVTGSFSTDDILYEGPFAHFAPDHIKLASFVHHKTENALFAVIILHLLALFAYFWRLKKNLVPAMITGSRPKAVGPSGAIPLSHTVFGLLLMAALIGLFQLAPLLKPSLF